MAIFEKQNEESTNTYIVLLDKSGENVVGFINPAKGIDMETLVKNLTNKGLNVEIRQSKADLDDFEL